jgi:hypothetical protein
MHSSTARPASRFTPIARCALRGAAIGALALSAALAHAAPVSFDFNTYAPLNGMAVGGFVVNTSDSAFIGNTGHCGPACVYNGSSYVISMGVAVGFTRTDGELFSLSSFDGAEAHMNTSWIWARHIRVVGEYANGSTVSTDFLLDGVNDATGPLADFQGFTLSSAYSGLRRVTFSGVGGSANFYTLDNVRFNGGTSSEAEAVPEPGSLALAGLALLAAVGAKRRRSA